MPNPFQNPVLKQNLQNIILAIKRGVVIPIIGYDLLFEDENDPSNDFLKQLIKIHTKDNDLEAKFKIKDERNLTGFELLNAYFHSLEGDTKSNFRTAISETIKKERGNIQITPLSLKKLISIKHFHLFINATITNCLEITYNTIRGEGTTEADIKSSCDVINYNTDKQIHLKPAPAPTAKFIINFPKPVIYNLLGTHDIKSGDFLITDADYIELIYEMINDNKLQFNPLLTYLTQGHLLFLGCNFPDWFFRFFIRICVGNRLDSVSNIERKAVIDSLNSIDSSRAVFINHYKIQSLPINCNLLIDEIYKAFSQENETADIISDLGNGIIFISYCAADRDVAEAIAAQFDEKYIQYFLDCHDLSLGDNLNNSITDAINRCCLFMPLISGNINFSSGYIWREIRYAKEQQKRILPIFREFVDRDVMINKDMNVTADLRDTILSRNNTLGIDWGKANEIPNANLREIKEIQYKFLVSGIKTL